MSSLYLNTITGIALFWGIAVITPGPNFIIILETSTLNGKQKALFTVAGIVGGTAIWTISGLLGINILFTIAPWFYKTAKIAGAVYLIYTGIGKLLNRKSLNLNEKVETATNREHFRRGLMVNLSNPKTAIFISSLFTAVVPEKMDITIGFLSLLTILFISFFWYSLLSLIFSHSKLRKIVTSKESVINRVSGALFVLLGVKLLVSDSGSK